MSFKNFVFSFVTAMAYCVPLPASSYDIVVNSKTELNSISQKDLKEIYSGEKTFWKSGLRIRAVRLADDNQLTQEFVTEILHQSIPQYLQAWRLKLFSGRALPPKKVASSAEMLTFIESNDGAIGFLPKNTPHSAFIKTIVVD